MNSGDTSQRMELLITKFGPRITHPVTTAGDHFITSVFIVVVVVGKTMLPFFCNDLVQGCNFWQTSIIYFRHVRTPAGLMSATRRLCSTHGAVQLRRISKIFNRSMHDRCHLWVQKCKGMSPVSFITKIFIQSSSVKGVPSHLRMNLHTNPSLRAVSVKSYMERKILLNDVL